MDWMTTIADAVPAWDGDVAKARALQSTLAGQVSLVEDFAEPARIAADRGLDRQHVLAETLALCVLAHQRKGVGTR